MEKIGLGIITCNRPDFFKKCLNSIVNSCDDLFSIVVVNDSGSESYLADTEINNSFIKKSILFHEIIHLQNQGVAFTKNDAFCYLLNQDCKYIFLIEDDIIIKDKNVFQKYIELYKKTGISHFNFGYHGPANKQNNLCTPRLIINYGTTISLALNLHCVGAFSFYTAECLKDVGLFDTNFINAWEHVEHTYQLIKKNYHPPFWWFTDLANSYEYLEELACSENNSTIRNRNDWRQNIQNGLNYFYQKHNTTPTNIIDTPSDNVIKFLKNKLEIIKHGSTN